MSAPRRPRPGPAPADRTGPADGPQPVEPEAVDPPLGRAAVVVGLVVLLVIAALGAVICVLLTPARIGSTLVPFAVVLSVALNIALPMLAFRISGSRGLAALPVLVFFLAGMALSVSPSGDVLLVGGSSAQTAISYATLLLAVLAGAVTSVRVR